MKLLVTGGAGFIGSNFIRYWITSNPDTEVVNLDKLTYAGNLESLKDISKNSNYRFIKGDIAEPEDVQKALVGVDIVVNFAAESHVDRSIKEPAVFIRTNVLGTQVLMDAALKNKVKKFVHISTDEVFGSLPLDKDKKFDETSPYDPRSPYSASKAASDMLVRAYGETFGLTYNITNCTNNYGPYMHPEKFIPLFITNALENKPCPLYGNGENVRDWLFVTDHAKAIEKVVKEGKDNETYFVSGDQEKSNKEVAREIIKLLGKEENLIEKVTDRPGHDLRYSLDSRKLQTELGWKPEVTFEEGLKRTIEWYKDNSWWWKPIKEGAFQEYYQDQYLLDKKEGGEKHV